MSEQTSKIKLDTPHVRVTYTDGEQVEVQTENPDMVFFDFERARRKWPSFQEAPFVWISYLAYSKIKRSGLLRDPNQTFENWVLTTVAIDNLNGDSESADLESVGPTLPAAAPA